MAVTITLVLALSFLVSVLAGFALERAAKRIRPLTDDELHRLEASDG